MKGKIFNEQEVQAILNGSKVIFREVVKNISPRITIQKGKNNQHFAVGDDWAKCPYQVGQKIFCKESFFANKNHNNLTSKDLPMDSLIMYAAGGGANVYGKKRPAQHMKQEHSRIILDITDIKVERLAEISEKDAIAEGVEGKEIEDTPFMEWLDYSKNIFCLTPSESFATLWNATHKKPEEKFEASPFVWVCTMEVVK